MEFATLSLYSDSHAKPHQEQQLRILAARRCVRYDSTMFHAIYCTNGHFIDSATDHPLGVPVREWQAGRNFCSTCSKPTIRTCQHCKFPILVDTEKPSFCGSCGKPYPWTETALQAASELADELEELNSEDRITLKETFSDLTADTPRTQLAATRFKRIMKKVTSTAGEALQKIMLT